MSDPSLPPFTQAPNPSLPPFTPAPNIQYDSTGLPWVLNESGRWVPVTVSSMVPKATVGPGAVEAKSPIQSTTQHFPPNVGAAGPPPAGPPAPLVRTYAVPYIPPLSDAEDRDLYDPPTIAKSHGRMPFAKVAGARHKSNQSNKKRRRRDDSTDDDEPAAKRRPGRPSGSSNFSTADTKTLLDIVAKRLPGGGKGWLEVQESFGAWAENHGRPTRSARSLEAKFKMLAKTRKPMGKGKCPPDVRRAKDIEERIIAHFGARDISDSEIVDQAPAADNVDSDNASDSSVTILAPPSRKVHTAVTRRAPTPPLRRKKQTVNAPELVNKLAQAFDPDVQQSHEDERANRSFQTTQIFTLSQQLRDSNATIENLRGQLMAMQNRVHEVERRRERAELMLRIPTTNRKDFFQGYTDFPRDGGKVRYPSDDESDKENKHPAAPSTSTRSHTSSYPSSSPLFIPDHPSTSASLEELRTVPIASSGDSGEGQ